MISLAQAKQLVTLLEKEQQQQANELFNSLAAPVNQPMLKEIGLLTRDLHNSLNQFPLDDRINELAKHDIPDARDRLQYVIDKTELAANKTMDAVECCLPIADQLHSHLMEVRPQWSQLMSGRIELVTFKALCHKIEALLVEVEGDSSQLKDELTNILMAQDFQDLTGQIIRRVITLVDEVERRLIDILLAFGSDEVSETNVASTQSLTSVEGPIINPQDRSDAVSSQSDVDDLLSTLGF